MLVLIVGGSLVLATAKTPLRPLRLVATPAFPAAVLQNHVDW